MRRNKSIADDVFARRVAVALRELDGTERAPDVSHRVARDLASGTPRIAPAGRRHWPRLAALLAISVTAVLWLQSPRSTPSGSGATTAQAGAEERPVAVGDPQDPLRLRPTDEALGHGYVRRDGAIHFLGGGATGAGPDATRIDRPSPEVVRGFARVGFGAFKICEGLDVDRFVALSEEYVRDSERVYHKVISPGVFLVVQLPDADPQSFEVLARNLARDKDHVWYYERIQRSLDPSTLELIDEGRVCKDHDSVQYQDAVIAEADPASFRHLGSAYYADRHRVYWCTQPVPYAEPATFEVLGGSFVAKDRNRVYRSGQVMPRYDAASLQLILHDPMGFQILSDKNGIHVNKLTFPRTKPGKVEVIDNLTAATDGLVLLVETSRFNPVTVFRQAGKLMAATPAYEPTSGEPQGTILAEVTPEGPVDIRTEPLPPTHDVPVVPSWQIDVLRNPELVQRMVEAGKRID